MKIKSKIVSYRLINEKKEEETKKDLSASEVVLRKSMDLTDRPEKLTGTTYKIKSPLVNASMYVTINNIEDETGIFPFEIFIQSKEVVYQQWITITARMISAIFRMAYTYKVDSSFVVGELNAINSSTGSYFKAGKVITSIVQDLGNIVQRHLQDIGYSAPKEVLPEFAQEKLKEVEKNPEMARNLAQCPVCGSNAVVHKDGCSTCVDCGDSKCG